MTTEQEILTDISSIYRKIDQCNRSKADLELNIITEQESIKSLTQFITEDDARIANNKRPRYEKGPMLENIERCKHNIELFHKTIDTENKNITRFLEVVAVLQNDLFRPKEIQFDAKTGQVITK